MRSYEEQERMRKLMEGQKRMTQLMKCPKCGNSKDFVIPPNEPESVSIFNLDHLTNRVQCKNCKNVFTLEGANLPMSVMPEPAPRVYGRKKNPFAIVFESPIEQRKPQQILQPASIMPDDFEVMLERNKQRLKTMREKESNEPEEESEEEPEEDEESEEI